MLEAVGRSRGVRERDCSRRGEPGRLLRLTPAGSITWLLVGRLAPPPPRPSPPRKFAAAAAAAAAGVVGLGTSGGTAANRLLGVAAR